MMGSFLTKALALVLGYAYPAYECFKTVELNKPEMDRLRFWCQYWLPMYNEGKVAFFVYLWYPKTKGTSYVYKTFFRPCVVKHETEIDRNLLELRTRAGDIVVLCSQRIVSYGQTRVFEILQYVASQLTSQPSRPRPAQQRPQPQQAHPKLPTTAALQAPIIEQPARQPRLPASPSKSQVHETTPLPTNAQPQPSGNTTTNLPNSWENVSSGTPNESEEMQVEVINGDTLNKDSNNPPPPLETVMEEAIRMTRGRLRKRAATVSAETR